MKLRELNIQKYRPIENQHLTFEDAFGRVQPVTVLAGPNGCGKTSILFAIGQVLRDIMRYRTEDVPEPTELDIFRRNNGEFLSKTPPQILVQLKIEFAPEERKAIRQVFEETRPIRLEESEQGLEEFPEGVVTVEWKYPPYWKPPGVRKPHWYLDKVIPRQALQWFKGRFYAIEGFKRAMLKTPSLLDDIGGPLLFPQDRSLKQRVAGLPRDKSEPQMEMSVWEILKELGQRATSPELPDSATNASLRTQAEKGEKRIKDLFHGICAPKEYLGFGYTANDPLGSPYFQEGHSRYPLALASSGEQVILEYITRLTFPQVLNHGIILIDEPEMHLHPGWIRQLYQALPKMGVDNQFILTTHSTDVRTLAAEDGVLIDLGDIQK